jgi:hypothetical protein
MSVHENPSGRSWRGYALVKRTWSGIVLLAACGVAFWIGLLKSPQQALMPVVSETALNFGEVWEDAEFLWELPIHNPGPTDLRIIEFISSCGCVSVEPATLQIAGGQTRAVRLTLDLRRSADTLMEASVDSNTTEVKAREFSASIGGKLETADGRTLPLNVWSIWGRVRPAMRLDSSAIFFVESQIEGQPVPARTVNVRIHEAVKQVYVRSEPELVSTELSAQHGQGYVLTIRPRSDLKTGPWKANVILQASTADKALRPVVISVEGVVRPDVQALPRSLWLGMCVVGQTLKDTVIVRSVSGKRFELLEVDASSPEITVIPLKVSSQEGNSFQVCYLATKEGYQNATLRFSLRMSGNGQQVVVMVPVAYHGMKKQTDKGGSASP